MAGYLSNVTRLNDINPNLSGLDFSAPTANLAQNNRSVSCNDASAITANNNAEIEQQAAASCAASAAKNAGVNNAAASLTGSQASTTNTASTANGIYTAANAQKASTQADYLKRMGELCGLCYKADNMNTANYLNTFGALMGSDENLKHGILGSKTTCCDSTNNSEQGCLDPNKLKEAVECFYSLKKQLDELKKENK